MPPRAKKSQPRAQAPKAAAAPEDEMCAPITTAAQWHEVRGSARRRSGSG